MFKADAVSSGSPISQGVNIILITHRQTNCFQINYSLEFNMVDYWQKSYSLTIKNIFSEVGRYKYIVHATYQKLCCSNGKWIRQFTNLNYHYINQSGVSWIHLGLGSVFISEFNRVQLEQSYKYF